MLPSAVRILFGRLSSRPLEAGQTPYASAPDSHVLTVVETTKMDAARRTVWPAMRVALANELWGTGFICPGGEAEILRLTRPLGVSSASSLLIVGVGSGGPASAVARNLGAWVTGMDNDPSLLAAARGLITKSRLNKKIVLKVWDPANPAFGTSSHHHCLALEPFHGGQPEPIVDALVRALKPNGQMVISALAAPVPLSPADPSVRRWAELEHRDPLNVLAPVAVTRMLGRIGLDVRVSEDISERHVENALLGWRTMMRELGEIKPNPQQAAQLVREAEIWLLRRRLIRDGRLRMMRWHAISRGPSTTIVEGPA